MSENQNNSTKRLLSLDIFRGITIIGMIIVNTPGSWEYVFPPLRHTEWNGLTPTDLVFPFFLFIVGVSIVLAYNKRLQQTKSKNGLVLKIIKRSVLIFILGIVLNLIGSNFEYFRIPGVLQRIAIVFLFCSLVFIYASRKAQIWTGISLLLGYYVLMISIPIPEFGAGVLLPGKNLAAWIDSQIIPFYMYQGTWDPEGILSTLPSIATGITGMLAGHIVISKRPIESKVILLFVAGIVSLMCGEIWSWFFPINKNIWTSSYVLYTSGLAAITWAVLIWVTDILGYLRWGKAGLVFGSNAITAYVLSYIIMIPLTYIAVYDGNNIQNMYMNTLIDIGVLPELASMVWALIYVILCYIPVKILYNKKIFLKI